MVPWELIAEINQSEHQCNQYTEDGEVGVKVWQVRQLLKLIHTMEAYIWKRQLKLFADQLKGHWTLEGNQEASIW